MILDDILGDAGAAAFLDEFYLKQPFSLAGGCQQLTHLGSWDTVREILASGQGDVMVARQGELVRDETPENLAAAQALLEEGCTVLVRNVERIHPALADLATQFKSALCGAVDVHVYCTPPKAFGFGWHYDAEDVFILQTQGTKHYSLRKNTVNPWPTVETLPDDMSYERELMPLWRCPLAAGDWLYIPNGYWHKAEAGDEASISLAVGVLSATALDVFDFLRDRLLGSLRWRQRLPTPGEAGTLSDEELLSRYREIFADLADDLAAHMRDPALSRRFLHARRQAHRGRTE